MLGVYEFQPLYLITACLAAACGFQEPMSQEDDPVTTESLSSWLSLGWLKELPPSRLRHLLSIFGSPTEIIGASQELLIEAGLSLEQAVQVHGCLHDVRIGADVDKALAWCDQDRHIITLGDDAYPPLLRQIEDAPPFLFVHGALEALQMPQVAVVGSRRCSVDGREAATSLSVALARAGLTICSGMATGIDTLSHQAALGAAGMMVAVLGTGIDIVYPKSNAALARQIADNGALVSELPLGAEPIAGHFPRRNRIISGLSLGVVVVEAALRSGSLITARLAMEQNREVFAVPGSIRNPLARGCHRLIREGAMLIESAEQVIEQIGSLLEFQLQTTPAVAGSGSKQRTAPADHQQAAVLAVIGFDPVPLDILVERTGLSVEALHTLLLMLELEGWVSCHGGQYQRV